MEHEHATTLTLADVHTHCTELGQQLCDAHLKIEDQALTIETLNRLVCCGDAFALEDLRRSLRARVGCDAPVCVSDAEIAALGEELASKRAECAALQASNARLQEAMGLKLQDARSLAVFMVETADREEISSLRLDVQCLYESIKRIKAEYEWEYRRREEYAKELVRMRDLTLVQDVELETLRNVIKGDCDASGDIKACKAKILALEHTLGALYKDKYIDDRNKRMGLALGNVRDAAMSAADKDVKIQAMARLIRRFERLTETTSAELERFRGTEVQREIEELYAKRVVVEGDIGGLVEKKRQQDAKFIEVSRDLQDAR